MANRAEGFIEQEELALLRSVYRWQHAPPAWSLDRTREPVSPDWEPKLSLALDAVPNFILVANGLGESMNEIVGNIQNAKQRGFVDERIGSLPLLLPFRMAWRSSNRELISVIGEATSDEHERFTGLNIKIHIFSKDPIFMPCDAYWDEEWDEPARTRGFVLTPAGEDRIAELEARIERRLSGLVSLVRAVGIIGDEAGRPDNLPRRLRARGLDVITIGGRNYASAAALASLFPKSRNALMAAAKQTPVDQSEKS